MRGVLPFVLLLVIPLRTVAVEPPKVEEFAPHASGVALVEVTAVEKYDMRPMDGNAGVRFKLKVIRGSGTCPEEVRVTTAHGGLRPPGFMPKPSEPVKSDSFKKGDRVWIAFSSHHEYDTYNQGVIGFWSEKDAKAESLKAAVKADSYRWHPQYEPKLKLSYGRVAEKDKWRVRVEKDSKVLWEREIPGKPTDAYFSWGLWGGVGGFEVTMPKCGQLLVAETSTTLEKDNEFGLEAGPYWINTGYDPETGKRAYASVRLPQGPSVILVNREYVLATNKPKREERFDSLPSGGKAVGAKTEDWYRKRERTFDADGKVTKEETFWYDKDAESEKRWVKVK